MTYSIFSIVSIVLVVSVVAAIGVHLGAEGAAVVSGPVCCTVSPVSQASCGFGQQDAVTRTIYCSPDETMKGCCAREMAVLLDSYVKVDGAMPGVCGSQNPFR